MSLHVRKALPALLLLSVAFLPVVAALTLTKITDPGTLPTGDGYGVAFSPGGEFMAVAHDVSPYITIYSVSGSTFTKLSNPAVLPAGIEYDVAFSDDGEFMAVAGTTFIIYQISGTTFTKIADPATLPAGFSRSVDFTTGSTHLAVAHNSAPYFTVYSISGTTFTKLADPTTTPTGLGGEVAWNPDGSQVAVAHTTTPFVSIYTLSGSTLTKIANPANLPTGDAQGVDYSADGGLLAVGQTGTAPLITIYTVSGTTYTKVTSPGPTFISTQRLRFSPDGEFLATSSQNSPRIKTYSYSGTTFTELSAPATLPTGGGYGLAWSPDMTFLAIAHTTSPRVTIYTTGEVFEPGVTPTAPSGLSAQVTQIQGPGGSLIDLRWPVSSNDPDQDQGQFDYYVFVNGNNYGVDATTGSDGDGQRFRQLNVVDPDEESSTLVIWVFARNGIYEGPDSCTVTINDGALAFQDCGTGAPGAGSTTVVAPSDASEGLLGFCDQLMGDSEGSRFLCGLIMIVFVMLGLAAGYAGVVGSKEGNGPLIAGTFGGLGATIFMMVSGIWPPWSVAIFLLIVAAVASVMIRRLFGEGASNGPN